MCKIITTQVDKPYPGVRQILCWSDLYKDEGKMIFSQQWADFTRIPKEERYSLMAFLMASKWSIACDILAEHPSLVASWALDFLRDMMLGSHLTAKDVDVLRTHIFVLDLARSLGIGQTRAFLSRLDG